MVADPARLIASLLDGAGHKGAGDTFRGLADATEAGANHSVLEMKQVDALSSLSNVSSTEVTKIAGKEIDPNKKAALHTLAHGFGELFQVLYQHKRLKGQDGPKRDDLKAQLIKITGDVATGAAALATGKTDQTAQE